MTPETFWGITLAEIVEITEAIYFDSQQRTDSDLEITAWQTSLLMNATGNFKKQITPEMLLKKDKNKSDEGGDQPKSNKLDKEEKDKLVKDLLAKFEK